MARGANFYYQGQPEALGAALGQTLGRALFGDPEAALKQRESLTDIAMREAQTKQAEAHARLFGTQADGQGIQNNALGSLPDLIAALVPQAPAPAPVAMPTDPLAPLPEGAGATAQVPGFDAATFQAGLPAVIAALAQSKGKEVDLGETIGALGAMLGNDEFARRGMVANGHTPGKEFALTPERADDIAKQGFDADHRKSTDVARINHATDIPVANIKAGADRDVAHIKGATDVDVANIKGDGSYDRAGAIALGNTLGTVTSTVRSAAHNKDVGGVGNSFHLASRGGRAVDIARAPGVTHAQVVAKYKAAGFTILESLDEGDHSHIALSGGPGAKGKGKGKASGPAVKTVNNAARKMIEGVVDDRLEGFEGEGDKSRFKNALMRRALQHYQRTGNPDDAVAQAFNESGLGKKRGAAAGGPVRITGDADYAKLASGAQFIGPDGKLRVKP